MLQKIVIFIDLLLNPKAINYPIAYCGEDCTDLPSGHIFIVKKEKYKDGYTLYYVRWI